jgi:AcrR family transcriptional regulator
LASASPFEGDKAIGPRSRKGVQTRARLVEAAKQVFEETGFLDARISDIAERAGLSHGSFYHYFESKDEIFLEVAEAEEERFTRDSIIESGLLDASRGTTILERLQASVRSYLEDYRAEARIMGVIEQVSRYHEPVRAVRFARQQHYLQQAEASIRQLQKQGLADPALDPAIAASALTGMVNRFAEMWLVQGVVDCPFDDGVDQLAHLCLNALRLQDPPAGRRRRPLQAGETRS